LAAERDQRAVAGVLIALTAVTSLPGALMVCHLAIILLRRDGWRPRFSQAWLLLGPVAAAGFLAYVAHLTGSLDAYSANQAGWGRTGLGTADGDAAMGAALGPIQMVLLLTLCASAPACIRPRGQPPPGVRARADPVAGYHFASGNLESVGRYATVAFPLFWLMAGRRGPAWRWLWPVSSAGMVAAFALLSFGGHWVP